MVSALVLKLLLYFIEPLKWHLDCLTWTPYNNNICSGGFSLLCTWCSGCSSPGTGHCSPLGDGSSVGLSSSLCPWGKGWPYCTPAQPRRVNHCCWSSENWINLPLVYLLCHTKHMHIFFPFLSPWCLNKQESRSQTIIFWKVWSY